MTKNEGLIDWTSLGSAAYLGFTQNQFDLVPIRYWIISVSSLLAWLNRLMALLMMPFILFSCGWCYLFQIKELSLKITCVSPNLEHLCRDPVNAWCFFLWLVIAAPTSSLMMSGSVYWFSLSEDTVVDWGFQYWLDSAGCRMFENAFSISFWYLIRLCASLIFL